MKALTLSARLTAAVALVGSGLVLGAPAAHAQVCHPTLAGVARAADGGFYQDARCDGRDQRPRQYIEPRDFCDIHSDAIVCQVIRPKPPQLPPVIVTPPPELPPVIVRPPQGGGGGGGYTGTVTVGEIQVIGSGGGGGYSGHVSVGPISSVGGSGAQTGTVTVGEVETVAE